MKFNHCKKRVLLHERKMFNYKIMMPFGMFEGRMDHRLKNLITVVGYCIQTYVNEKKDERMTAI